MLEKAITMNIIAFWIFFCSADFGREYHFDLEYLKNVECAHAHH